MRGSKAYFAEKADSIRAIAFDFDGVILNSVHIKTEAFRDLFANHPQHQDAIVAYHLANGGVSRYLKFRYFYENLFHKEYTPEIEKELGERFSQLVFEKVLACSMVKGASAFLTESFARWPLAVISGTPQEELDEIIDKRGLRSYFRQVIGAPTTKDKGLRAFASDRKLHHNEILFFGDAMTDYNAAIKVGTLFIGIHGETTFPPDTPCISDFTDLYNLLPPISSGEEK